MSELRTPQGWQGRMDATRAGDPAAIRWIRPDTPAYVPPAPTKADRIRRSENTTAMIVICLTFACTLLAVFDLFQLASGF